MENTNSVVAPVSLSSVELQSIREKLLTLPEAELKAFARSIMPSSSTDAAKKLFSAQQGEKVALEFTPESGMVSGMFRVIRRDVTRGRAGNTVLTLASVAIPEDIRTLSSQDNGADIVECAWVGARAVKQAK